MNHMYNEDLIKKLNKKIKYEIKMIEEVNKDLERAKKPYGVFQSSWDIYRNILKHDENGFYFELQEYYKISHEFLIKHIIRIDECTARFSLTKCRESYEMCKELIK